MRALAGEQRGRAGTKGTKRSPITGAHDNTIGSGPNDLQNTPIVVSAQMCFGNDQCLTVAGDNLTQPAGAWGMKRGHYWGMKRGHY